MRFLWLLWLLASLASFSEATQEEKEPGTEDEVVEAQEEEPFLGILDYFLLAALGGIGYYYFFYSKVWAQEVVFKQSKWLLDPRIFCLKEKKEETKLPAYVIQPTAPIAGATAAQDKSFLGNLLSRSKLSG